MTNERTTAMITGASSGIGREFARRLAADHDLVLVARRVGRLESLADELRATGAAVEVIGADLGIRSDLDALLHRLVAGDIAVLVGNAGAGGYAPFADVPLDEFDRLLTLNAVAPMEMVRAALPGMLERGSGSIVTVSSLLAFSAGQTDQRAPRRAAYASAKAATVAFSRLVANELGASGIRVQVLCPGLVATEFHGPDDPFADRAMSAEDVVQASLTGLELGEVVCIPGLEDAPAALAALMAAESTLQNAAFATVPAERYRPRN